MGSYLSRINLIHIYIATTLVKRDAYGNSEYNLRAEGRSVMTEDRLNRHNLRITSSGGSANAYQKTLSEHDYVSSLSVENSRATGSNINYGDDAQ